jgi:hypothetical protein
MIALLVLALGCGTEEPAATRERPIDRPPIAAPRTPPEAEPAPALPAGLRCLITAYPDALRERAGTVALADGTPAIWDDGRDKDLDQRIADPDLEDVLAQRYPAGAPIEPVPAGVEPGRVRHDPLFEAAYGRTPEEVRRSLVEVRWPFQARAIEFQSQNGAAAALERVAARLQAAPAHVRRCVAPSAGTYNARNIRGTDQPSAHSYGIAIDVAISCGDYWLWARPFTGVWRNRMPEPIVTAFEAERFVWGGRWHRYDTMHFEYRPELFACGPPAAERPE